MDNEAAADINKMDNEEANQHPADPSHDPQLIDSVTQADPSSTKEETYQPPVGDHKEEGYAADRQQFPKAARDACMEDCTSKLKLTMQADKVELKGGTPDSYKARQLLRNLLYRVTAFNERLAELRKTKKAEPYEAESEVILNEANVLMRTLTDLSDDRPRRDSGPNSDTMKKLGPGRVADLQHAIENLKHVMWQINADLVGDRMTKSKAQESHEALAKLSRALHDRLVALRYIKLADLYEESCTSTLNDSDALVRRLQGDPGATQKELSHSLQDVRVLGKEDHTSLRSRDSNPRTRSGANSRNAARSEKTHSSTSSRRRIMRSKTAALEVKSKAIERVEVVRQKGAVLRNQMEMEELEEEQRDAQRKVEEEQRDAQRKVEKLRRKQDFENCLRQMKVEEEREKLQMELDAAKAATVALENTSQSQKTDSLLNSLPMVNPVEDLYMRRSDDLTVTFNEGVQRGHGFEDSIAHGKQYVPPARENYASHYVNADPTIHNATSNRNNHEPRTREENSSDRLAMKPMFRSEPGGLGDTRAMQSACAVERKERNYELPPHRQQKHRDYASNSPIRLEDQRRGNTTFSLPAYAHREVVNGPPLNPNAPPFISSQPTFNDQHAQSPTYESAQQHPCFGTGQNDNTRNNPLREDNLAKSIADALTITRLPVPKPTVFKGDPLQYSAWFAAFSHLVKNEVVGPEDKMLILREFIEGPARAAVGDLYFDLSKESYNDALAILKRRFGEDHAIAEAVKDKLATWPDVRNKDVTSLRDFADYVRQCCTMAKKVSGLGILEDSAQIRSLARKLPDALSISWGQRVTDHKSQHGTYPSLADFVKFLERQSEALKEADLSSKTRRPNVGEGRNPNRIKGGQAFASTNEVGGGLNAIDPPELRSTGTLPARKPFGHKSKCLFCDDDHFTPDCEKLTKKPFEERKEFARKKRLCFKCLKGSHAARGCFAKVSCDTCKAKHVTVMHDPYYTPRQHIGRRMEEDSEETPRKVIAENQQGSGSPQGEVKTSHKVEQNVGSRLSSLYMPVYVSARAEPDNEVLVYAMLDTMSDTSFIIEPVMEQLNLHTHDTHLTLRTLTSEGMNIKCKSCTDLCVRAFDSNDIIEVPRAYSQKELSVDRRQIPTRETVNSIPHLRHLSSHFYDLHDAPIGLLLGVNVSEALRPLQVENGEPGQPYAQRTRLGWGVVGETGMTATTEREKDAAGARSTTSIEASTPPTRNGALCFRTKDHTNEHLIASMERDFACKDEEPTSQDDHKFIHILTRDILMNEEGHYQMPLPFKNGEPCLPDNRRMALRRLTSLRQRFLKNSEHFRLYKEFMQQMFDRRDAERVPDEEVTPGAAWYIPHHGVYNPNKPGKVRIVFDCAATCQDVSLNDFLLCGPDLMNSLIGVLCRFRLHPVAVSCDVERMFHQFHVAPQHRNYLRFLWWPNNDLNRQPVDYRMRVHLFGAASSPGCANFALKRLASDNQHISSEASDFIQNDFYVDDGLTSREDEAEAIRLLKGAREICDKGELRLHKIASNRRQVMSAFPESEVVKSEGAVEPVERSENSIERALGIRWSLDADTLHFSHVAKEMPVTKRGVLSTVASIFDPLGLVSPIILTGRQILQEACREGIDWDEKLSQTLTDRWGKWLMDLRALSSVQIPRCYFPEAVLPWTSIEFHHFADASTSGYGECSYLRIIDRLGNPHSSLVMAKSRVTPLRAVTVPRLELQAAVLAVKIARFLDKEFSHLQAHHHFWTDSSIVLGYIYNETRRFHVFVANRLQQIREFSQPQQWSHVDTNVNPADHASRGLTVEEMKKSNWESGPEFLRQQTIAYDRPDASIEEGDREVKAFNACTASEEQGDVERLIKRFSSLESLLRVISRIIAWRRRARRKDSATGIQTTTMLEDREAAFKRVVKGLQLAHYPPQSGTSQPELKQLDPFTDEEGLLRVGGRLAHSEEERHVKNPLIIPRTSHLAVLLARHHHRRCGHQGRTSTLGALQSNGLWICGSRRVVSAVIHTCVHCARTRGRPMEQKMADLPPDRTEIAPPFSNTGLDCFGPFQVKRGRSEVKRYGLIFTCLASRAVHLEVLEDMTTDAFICGLRRFIAIRGNVRTIRCDQGTNFVGAARELRQARHEMNENKIVEQMVDRRCTFSFNPPAASHFGGVWERLIRTVRQVLSGLLEDHGSRLTPDTLSTLFYEVAGIVNNRPLCVADLEDPTACEPLTPNHLLTLKPEPVFPPPGSFQKEDMYSRKRWRRVQYLAEQFWSRWKGEYLPLLQPRRKWYQQKDTVKEGMVVLMSDEDAPRGTWKMARVEKTYPSKDGLVRSVQLRLATVQRTAKGPLAVRTTFLDRPIHKLVPLNLGEKG